MRDDGRVVLVRQYRAQLDREIWELPAGRLNAASRPKRRRARECEEEIGLVPQRDRAAGGVCIRRPGFCDEELIFFRVPICASRRRTRRTTRTRTKTSTTQAFTVAEAQAMVARGEIVDLKTAYALTLI